jgi:type VI secretion system protein ImpA
MEKLLEEHWQDVHPRGEDGDFALRMVAIEALDASPTVLMPLQFMPLIEHKRYGNFSQRMYLLARGEQQPRGEEQALDLATVNRILEETELPILIEKRDQLRDLDTTLKQMRTVWQDNSSGPPITLERLPAALAQIVGALDSVIARRDPSAASAPSPDADGTPAAALATGLIGSAEQAASALATVADYFSAREPSNPALLLVRQAHALLGKSFLDVMRILIPDQVASAAFNIGREQFFDLPVERLAEFAASNGEIVAGESPAEETEAAPEGAEAVVEETETASEEAQAAPEGAEEGVAEEEPAAEEQPEPVADGDGTEAPLPAANIAARVPRLFSAETRAQALALLDQVAAYLRSAEPSSPIPFLVERARDLAQRDFLSVLKALLPAGTLREPERDQPEPTS